MSSEFIDITSVDPSRGSDEWHTVEAIYSGRFCLGKASRYDKFFILKSAADPSDLISVALLRKEFELTYHLDHPSIRRAYGIEKIDGVGDVLVLEYIDGRPLDAPDVAGLPKVARRQIVVDLLSAIDYLHSRQIIHRDLKPENILITFNGSNVKLIDLGFSDADNLCALKSPAGTLGYIAPEQQQGEPLDTRADIYSLGVVLERYFADVVPRSVRRRCSDEEPAHRFGSAREVTDAITHRAKRKRLLGRLVIACFVIGVLAGIYLMWRKYQPAVPIDPIPKIDTVIVEVPVVRVDTIVIEKPAPPTQAKPKSHPTSQKVEGGYTAVIQYPNAVDGYSVSDLGAIADKTLKQINQIIKEEGKMFDSPAAFNARILPIVEENFKGIPHTLQKQFVLDNLDSRRSRYVIKKNKVVRDSISEIK